jgi:hypothetical protein
MRKFLAVFLALFVAFGASAQVTTDSTRTGIGGGTTCTASDTQVLFMDATACSGDTGLTFNKTTDTLTLGGNIYVALAKAFAWDAAGYDAKIRFSSGVWSFRNELFNNSVANILFQGGPGDTRNGISVAKDSHISFSSTTDADGVVSDDVALRRNAAGVAEITKSMTANDYGDLKLRHTINTGLRASSAAPTIASAGTIAPTTSIVFISGTAAIATITAPSPISAGGGQITLIPTGLFTTTTAGNIALATTAVVNKALTMTYDTTTTKWYPSY